MRATRRVNSRGPWLRVPAPAAIFVGAAIMAMAMWGCSNGPKPSEPRTPREVQVPDYLKDTVGEVARLAGREPVQVQGYGFVTGLDGTGTKVVPPGIRQQILDMMLRNKVVGAQEILSNPDNAVVMVTGLMDPGIAEGERFDLEVRAVPSTETTSLEGGFLLECDLARVMATRGVAAKSDIQAYGRGSLFVAPAVPSEKDKTAGDPRVGRVLAGGVCRKARQFRLVLMTPSARTADQIVRQVNTRFDGAAKGTQDPGRVDLSVPKEFQDDKTRFLDLVGSIYMRELPDARDQRVNLLIETLKSGKDMDRVSLYLEAFGGSVVPRLRPLADHPSEAVRFYTGRMLADLQDALAVSVLEPIALSDASEFQEQAVEALGRLRNGRGLGVLGRAIDCKNARVRVAAWQAMERLAPRTFVSRVFPDKFVLSLVGSRAEPFVYISRTLKPAVAIFGAVSVQPPVLAETRRVIASAPNGATGVKLISRWHEKDYAMEAPLDLKGLIEKMALPMGTEAHPEPLGMNLGYSDVVGVLSEMSRKKGLTAPLVIQPLKYHIGGDRPTARPIGEAEE